jgi:head-tail adaptor
MTVDDRMIHSLAIERASAGASDDYGQPTQAWGSLATTRALIVTRSAIEVALLSQGGAVVSTVVIGVPIGTDLVPADRLHHVPAACTVAANDLPDVLYELTGVRDASGAGIYLRCDAVEIT